MQFRNEFVQPFRSRAARGAVAATLALAGAALAGIGVAVADPASDANTLPREAGVWIDDTGKGAIRIEPCGNKLCGRIVWLRSVVNDKGEILRDRHNPDPSMRDRLICGLPVLGQLQATAEGGYDGGWVYDPKVGKAFDVAIRLASDKQLKVTGYKGIKLFSKSFVWTRAESALPDCNDAIGQLGAAGGNGGDAAQATPPPSRLGGGDVARASGGATAQKGKTKATSGREVLPWAKP